MHKFSLVRWSGVVLKELHELSRDKISAAMIFLTPLLQLILLGYAVNMDPHHIPAALLNYDNERLSEVFVSTAQNTGYFSLSPFESATEAEKAFSRGDVLFIITIPQGFTEKILRAEKPQLLIQADAIDPMATGNALNAIVMASKTLFQHDLPPSLAGQQSDDVYDLVIHRMFNPEGITQFNTIPGIIGSILSTTLILMTALAVTRERESGAMENLLISPVTAFEVMMGKITPFVLIGVIQAALILVSAIVIFELPLVGNLLLVFFILMIYIFLCLSIGITISSLAHSQLQALQMSSFYFIPSVMLSGFISPFISMPFWAQWLGSCLPLTYFIRLMKGVMLKGYSLDAIWPDLMMLVGLSAVIMFIALKSWNKTLD